MAGGPADVAPDARQLPCELSVGARGVAVSWRGHYGPAVAVLRSPRAISATRTRHVEAVSPEIDDDAPDVGWYRGRLRITYKRGGGAWTDMDDGASPRCIASEATAVAHAVGRKAMYVATTDGEGVVLHRLDPASGEPVAPADRLVHRADVAPVVSVVATGAGALVLYGLVDEPLVGVASTTGGDTPSDVRHPVRSSCAAIDAVGVGSSTAVALSLRRGRVHAALLGPEGGMRERPHEVLHAHGGRLGTPRVVWMENTFAVAAVDSASRQLRVAPLDRRRSATIGATVPRFEEPFAVAYHDRQVIAARIVRDARQTRLWLSSADRTGSALQTVDVDVTPHDTKRCRNDLHSREAIRRLRAQLVSEGYRRGGERVTVDADQLGLSAYGGGQTTRLQLVPRDAGVDLALRVRPRGSLEALSPRSRLADGLRRMWRVIAPRARARAAADVQTARHLLTEGGSWSDAPRASLQRVERTAGTLAVDLWCERLPGVATLQGWMARFRHWMTGASTRGSRVTVDAGGGICDAHPGRRQDGWPDTKER